VPRWLRRRERAASSRPQPGRRLQAGHGLEGAVDEAHAPLGVEGHKAVRAQFEDRVELFGVLVQASLGAAALGDVGV
jgi:hypothetical protein